MGSAKNTFARPFVSSSIPISAPTIFVVEDDISVLASLELAIRCEGWQPKTFKSAQEFIAHPRPLVPSCLVLALSPRDPAELDLQVKISRERPETPIIVTSSYADIPTTVQAMKAGAFELLVKPFSDDALLAAIRQGLERSRVALDHEMELRDVRYCYDSLSSREQQVMALVVSGLLNKQVAGQLGIAEITVKRHRGRVMRKMGADSLPVLVHIAATLGVARPQRRNRVWEWNGSSSAVRAVGSALRVGP